MRGRRRRSTLGPAGRSAAIVWGGCRFETAMECRSFGSVTHRTKGCCSVENSFVGFLLSRGSTCWQKGLSQNRPSSHGRKDNSWNPAPLGPYLSSPSVRVLLLVSICCLYDASFIYFHSYYSIGLEDPWAPASLLAHAEVRGAGAHTEFTRPSPRRS